MTCVSTKKKVAVLGGTGFIGQNIILKLSGDYEITSVSRGDVDVGSNYRHISINKFLKIDHYFDVVINCLNSYEVSKTHEMNFVNVDLPLRLIQHLHASCDPVVILFDTFFRKNESSARYMDGYIKSKQLLTKKVSDLPLANIVTLSLEHIYGPYDRPSKFLNFILTELSKGRDIVLKNPNFIRDFTYVDDVVTLIDSLAKERHFFSSAGRFDFEVGTGTGTSVFDFVNKLARRSNSTSKILEDKTPLDLNELRSSGAQLDPHLLSIWKPVWTVTRGIDEWLRNEAQHY